MEWIENNAFSIWRSKFQCDSAPSTVSQFRNWVRIQCNVQTLACLEPPPAHIFTSEQPDGVTLGYDRQSTITMSLGLTTLNFLRLKFLRDGDNLVTKRGFIWPHFERSASTLYWLMPTDATTTANTDRHHQLTCHMKVWAETHKQATSSRTVHYSFYAPAFGTYLFCK